VRFEGPFSWPGTPDAPSIFDVERRKEPGIYLWTVPQPEGHLVTYVGETSRSFEMRMLEHYIAHASGMYHVYSPAEFARGVKVVLWPGRYDREERKSVKDCIGAYPRLSVAIHELTYLYRFLLAPLKTDDRLRKRMEAAAAEALCKAPGLPGSFQDKGVRYDRRSADEEPIECRITSPVTLLGLPDGLLA